MSMKATIQELTAEGAFFEVRDIPTARGDFPGYAHAPKTLTEIIQNARGHGGPTSLDLHRTLLSCLDLP